MNNAEKIELFLLKCAVIEGEIRRHTSESPNADVAMAEDIISDNLDLYIKQFDLDNRKNANKMARYYQIFYMLENDIRKLIAETMEATHGSSWWDKKTPQATREEAKKNRAREQQAGVSPRSDEEIDYITFGQLGDIIRENWGDFAGIMSNQSAVIRVLSGLNMLRGTIAHCGLLAEDEVDRLKLAIKDWFRVLEGPKS